MGVNVLLTMLPEYPHHLRQERLETLGAQSVTSLPDNPEWLKHASIAGRPTSTATGPLGRIKQHPDRCLPMVASYPDELVQYPSFLYPTPRAVTVPHRRRIFQYAASRHVSPRVTVFLRQPYHLR